MPVLKYRPHTVDRNKHDAATAQCVFLAPQIAHNRFLYSNPNLPTFSFVKRFIQPPFVLCHRNYNPNHRNLLPYMLLHFAPIQDYPHSRLAGQNTGKCGLAIFRNFFGFSLSTKKLRRKQDPLLHR
jgi:hypothetical protein